MVPWPPDILDSTQVIQPETRFPPIRIAEVPSLKDPELAFTGYAHGLTEKIGTGQTSLTYASKVSPQATQVNLPE
jgi:hypothetical protein